MTIHRWTWQSQLTFALAAGVIAILGLVPSFASDGVIERLTVLFIYVILAAMWNALAGYGGLVSIGNQLFFGLGAYATIRLADAGINPFAAMSLGAGIVAGLSWLLSLFMLHLRAGEFAIGMWVLASIAHLCVNLDPLIQGETGTSLIALNAYAIDARRVLIFWAALIGMVGLLALLFAVLRTPSGLAMQAIRDNEEAADSVGVNPMRTKRLFFVLAGFGTAVAGALWLAQVSAFQPKTYFSVQWTAYMIFMVLVGGLGRFEGAILGALIFFAAETWFADTGVWYLIGLGAAALLFSLLLPKGLWGWIATRTGVSLMPLGYRVHVDTQSETGR
ncbi:branched-chain amino acid ABC transporter permease [Pseudophaeobacter arcticus]|jgi:branched-chain amino acid transport system permease protein|uniref:branched-chain amino acid ABC transporter permease n=1 Tax=Pseudophaeobacter arcticus TaxID=385492 RepID=UPI0004069420|nr:branched-chain amino acid ABC transporter permease [Pseudophaeobacter arcticus]